MCTTLRCFSSLGVSNVESVIAAPSIRACCKVEITARVDSAPWLRPKLARRTIRSTPRRGVGSENRDQPGPHDEGAR